MKMLGCKYYCATICLVFVTCNLHAQLPKEETSIIGSVATGEKRVSAPKKPRPVFSIKNTKHGHIAGRPVTIHEVEPPPTPAIKIAPLVRAPQYTDEQVRKMVEEMISTRVIFLSATVYGKGANQLTKLRVGHEGKECEVITNINFNHFTGFGGFRVRGQEYMQLVGVVNAIDDKGRVMKPAKDDLKKSRYLARSGMRNRYTVVKMDDDDTSLRQILDDLVTLYEKEKDHLAAAYETRLANNRRRAAKLAAEGPPPPKPITNHFWKRDVEQEQEQAAQKGEFK